MTLILKIKDQVWDKHPRNLNKHPDRIVLIMVNQIQVFIEIRLKKISNKLIELIDFMENQIEVNNIIEIHQIIQ